MMNLVNPADPLNEIEQRILDMRLQEIRAREELVIHLKAVDAQKLWRKWGYRSLRAFCEDNLGYSPAETRDLLIQMGLIVPSHKLSSSDPTVQRYMETLKDWRRLRSTQEGIAAYRIFPNKTLVSLAHERPQTLLSLSKIPGLGHKRVESFGASLLEVLNKLA